MAAGSELNFKLPTTGLKGWWWDKRLHTEYFQRARFTDLFTVFIFLPLYLAAEAGSESVFKWPTLRLMGGCFGQAPAI